MTEVDVRLWIRSWAAKYDASKDDVLARLQGLPSFTHDDGEVVIKWKVVSYKQHSLDSWREESPDQVDALTTQAFASSNDLEALAILDELGGVGPPVASAFLMAQDPARFTVMDPRALESLASLQRLEAPGATVAYWLPYLAACRKLATETGESLRTVDRALYKANGFPGLPPE